MGTSRTSSKGNSILVTTDRFTAVTWPARFNGTKAATSYGKTCIQDPTSTKVETQDEACLNFNVFRTPGVPLDQKLPVLLWVHGGAFYAGSYQSFDGASFAASSKVPIVVVTFHYRINSLGFLPSPLFEEEGLLNLGLRDQHLFLQFMQKHIGSFLSYGLGGIVNTEPSIDSLRKSLLLKVEFTVVPENVP